jgi:hypothetical protein
MVEDRDGFYRLFWQTTIGFSPSRCCNVPLLSLHCYLQLLSLTLDNTEHVLLLTHSPANPPLTPLHKSNVLFTSHVTKQIITAPLSLGCVLNWEILQDPQARNYGVRRSCCGKSSMEEYFRFPVCSSPPSLAPCLWRPPSPIWERKVGVVAKVMMYVHIFFLTSHQFILPTRTYEGESKIIRNVATYCAVGYTAGWA